MTAAQTKLTVFLARAISATWAATLCAGPHSKNSISRSSRTQPSQRKSIWRSGLSSLTSSIIQTSQALFCRTSSLIPVNRMRRLDDIQVPPHSLQLAVWESVTPSLEVAGREAFSLPRKLSFRLKYLHSQAPRLYGRGFQCPTRLQVTH